QTPRDSRQRDPAVGDGRARTSKLNVRSSRQRETSDCLVRIERENREHPVPAQSRNARSCSEYMATWLYGQPSTGYFPTTVSVAGLIAAISFMVRRFTYTFPATESYWGIPVSLSAPACPGRACGLCCVGDHQPEIQIDDGSPKIIDGAFLREVNDDTARFDTESLAQLPAKLIEKGLAPCRQDNIETFGSELPCELRTNARRCPRNQRPGAIFHFEFGAAAHARPPSRAGAPCETRACGCAPARVRVGGRSAQDARTRAPIAIGTINFVGSSPTAACENTAPTTSNAMPA